MLRSATRGRSNFAKAKKKKCHLCRARLDDFQLTFCLNFAQCRCAFCTSCLEHKFKSQLRKDRPKRGETGWVCFVCKGACHCERCRTDIREELEQMRTEISCDRAQLFGCRIRDSKPQTSAAARIVLDSPMKQPVTTPTNNSVGTVARCSSSPSVGCSRDMYMSSFDRNQLIPATTPVSVPALRREP